LQAVFLHKKTAHPKHKSSGRTDTVRGTTWFTAKSSLS